MAEIRGIKDLRRATRCPSCDEKLPQKSTGGLKHCHCGGGVFKEIVRYAKAADYEMEPWPDTVKGSFGI